jgi:hypothetical protein
MLDETHNHCAIFALDGTYQQSDLAPDGTYQQALVRSVQSKNSTVELAPAELELETAIRLEGLS